MSKQINPEGYQHPEVYMSSNSNPYQVYDEKGTTPYISNIHNPVYASVSLENVQADQHSRDLNFNPSSQGINTPPPSHILNKQFKSNQTPN